MLAAYSAPCYCRKEFVLTWETVKAWLGLCRAGLTKNLDLLHLYSKWDFSNRTCLCHVKNETSCFILTLPFSASYGHTVHTHMASGTTPVNNTLRTEMGRWASAHLLTPQIRVICIQKQEWHFRPYIQFIQIVCILKISVISFQEFYCQWIMYCLTLSNVLLC